LLGLAIALLSGCGGADAVAPEPKSLPFVQCKVVLAGSDVAGAIVTLHAEGELNRTILGAFDSENDCYRFITNADGKMMPGVPKGRYKATVKPGRGTRMRIPARYADPKSSNLTIHVAEGINFLPPLELSP
jgi:hypothetical protein